MHSKMKVATPVIFVLIMIMASVLILFSSTSTQAAVPNLSTKQPAQIVGTNQEQPIIRPELTLSASIAPEPVVGEVVTLRLEVTSALDEPDASIIVQMSDEIDLIAGNPTWNGSLNADAPLVQELSIAVREAGDWVIDVKAATSGFALDSESLHIISTATNGQVIPNLLRHGLRLA